MTRWLISKSNEIRVKELNGYPEVKKYIKVKS